MLTKGICQRNSNHKFALVCQSSFSGAYFYILLNVIEDHLWEVGMDDEEISIDGDQQDGEGGEEDAGGLRGAHHLADDLLVMIMIMMILMIMVIMVIMVLRGDHHLADDLLVVMMIRVGHSDFSHAH